MGTGRGMLFEPYDPDYECDTGNFVFGHIERWVVGVVGYHFEAVIGCSGH